MTKRKTHEEFIDEFYNMCQSIDVLGTYKTTDTPIECRCKDCNHVWFPTPNKLLHGRRCPVCANKKRGIACRCKICGYEWSVTPNDLLCGSRCANCSGVRKLTHNEFINRLSQKNESYRKGEIEVLDNYISSSHKITVKCLLCNRVWKSNPQDLLAGHSCGCNNRSINRYIKGINDFATCCSDLCLDWDYSKNEKAPNEYTKTSKDIWL